MLLIPVLHVAGACLPPPSGLVGWWPGQGNASDVASTNNGSLLGGATASAAGEVGTAFGFDGTNASVQILDSPAFHPAQLTVEAWVNFSSLDSAGLGGSPAGEQYLVFKQNSQHGNFEGFALTKERVSGGDKFQFQVTASNGVSVVAASTTMITTGVWYHVAGVRGSNFVQIYVNGQLQQQTSAGFAQDYGTLPLFFGTSGESYWDHKLKGALDEVSLYNRALASNEIAAIYAAGSSGKCLGPAPPNIVSQPQGVSVPAGSNASFSVSAQGTDTLGYQWDFGGTPIAGATNTSFTVTNVQAASAGNYIVVVTNSAGATTSAVAVLTLLLPPSFTSQPQNSTNNTGDTATFSASVTGATPMSFQWQRNGLNLADGGRISGSSTASLTIIKAQTGDAGNYDLVAANSLGTSTSAVAVLSVSGPPAIIVQPASQSVPVGASTSFSVQAAGTPPLAYQWLLNGVALSDGGNDSGTATPSLSVLSVQSADIGSYQVVVTNSVGAVTSSVANLSSMGLFALPPASTNGADAAVLVNSQSPRYADFQHWIQPYLDNFGVPYTVIDISTNPVSSGIARYALIIVGHSQLDPTGTLLNSGEQQNISLAVYNGTGLVNFDNALADTNGAPLHEFVQDVFEFSYSNTVATTASNLTLPPTESGGQMHYITALHSTGDFLTFSNRISLPGLTLPSDATAIGVCGNAPLVVIRKCGQGRAVQWTSYDWMAAAVKGPLAGMDDLLWRSIVWAARKPFVMRGMPHFATMRIDDVTGDLENLSTSPQAFWWVHQMIGVGFKPWLALFIDDISYASRVWPADGRLTDLSNMVASGSVTASVHAFSTSATNFFYFNHALLTEWPDNVVSNHFAQGTAFLQAAGIPSSTVVIAHYSEIGTNAFAGLTNWGVQFFMTETVPGTTVYEQPYAPWLAAGPYRLYDTPQLAESNVPFYYADWLTVPGHPELNGKFFNCYTEIRGIGPALDWAPTNGDIPGSIQRGYTMLKRGFDSQTLPNIFTHEFFINPSDGPGYGHFATNNFMTVLQGITNAIGAYQPIYVTMDYACQYVRATRTSRLVSASYDPAAGHVSVNMTGKTDLDTAFMVFNGTDSAITSSMNSAPPFTGSNTVTAGVSAAASPSATQSAQPLLTATLTPARSVQLSWPMFYPGFQIQSCNGTGAPFAWTTLTNAIQVIGNRYCVTVPPGAAEQTFRLVK